MARHCQAGWHIMVAGLAGWAAIGSAAAAGPAGAAPSAGSEARGLVRSLSEASITSEIAARIVRLPFREGETFNEGDVLVAFDCAAIEAAAAGAEADLKAARTTLETSREMLRMKAAGQRDVDMAESRQDKAAAELNGMRARLRACVVKAPFAGAVVDRPANLYEVTAPSTPLMRIVDTGRLEIELIVPSSWLGLLVPGADLSFKIDETGKTYLARVERLGAAIDPVSQTVKVFATFEGPHEGIIPGMSGTATMSGTGASGDR